LIENLESKYLLGNDIERLMSGPDGVLRPPAKQAEIRLLQWTPVATRPEHGFLGPSAIHSKPAECPCVATVIYNTNILR
jgi:hypothetical protein